jgi:hypothetical protein
MLETTIRGAFQAKIGMSGNRGSSMVDAPSDAGYPQG